MDLNEATLLSDPVVDSVAAQVHPLQQQVNGKLWPDLSAHGVTLGIVESDHGRKSLVFSDETGKHANIARNMGFSKTRWPGLWVRNEVRIEPSSFRTAFPKAEITMMSADEISERILEAIRARAESSAQFSLPGFGVTEQLNGSAGSTLKSKKTAIASAAASAGVGSDTGLVMDLSPLSIEAVPLGMNKLGEEVYETPDGRRFARAQTTDGSRVRREVNRSFPDADEAGLFLRGDTAEALDISAEGLVWAMSHGRTVRVDDFGQFFRAVTGRQMPKNLGDDPDFLNVAQAVDRARVRRLAQLSTTPDADAFAAALRLHEAAQYYTIIANSRMTPLPLAVALQHVASAMPEGSSIRVTNSERGEFRVLSGGSFIEAAEGEQQDILLGAYEGTPLERAVEALGTIVARDDHAQTLTSLERMKPEGLGIFVIDGDAVPGRIGPSSRRFLDALASHHEIEGMVDVDGALMGVPGSDPKRIIVVGKRREYPSPPVLPDVLPYVTDYESLWMWSDRITESVRKPGSVPMALRGAISSTDTKESVESFQSPYIPTSTLSEPTLMVPRNLASPLRRAMIEIQRTTPHTDHWLAEQLGMGMEELRNALSPEQADAAVMAFKRIEEGMGFMVADQTGTGKGRILAAAALRQRLRGEPVVFLTEKADLFTDFWRDIENIGAERFFKNILVLNDGAKVTSTKTGQVVAAAAPREQLEGILRSMEIPDGTDLVMATYSQFNRDPIKASKKNAEINFADLTKSQVSQAVRDLVDLVRKQRERDGKKAVKEVAVDSVDIFADPLVLQKMPLEALKPIWIGRVTSGKTLILDESHNAAGEDSQTAMNLIHATMNAKSVIYSSATFARGEKNMRAYRRLFPDSVDVEGLHETLKKGGEPLQEALSSMLAEDGALVRREHDLSMVTFVPQIDIKRTIRNEQLADELAGVLAAMGSLSREVREYSDALSDEMRKALEATNAAVGRGNENLKDIGVVSRPSNANSLYTTMRAFLIIIKNDLTVQSAVEHLKEGRKPGIIIEHTMEADLNRAIVTAKERGEAQETLDGLVIPRPTFRTLLRSMLSDMCKVSLDGTDLEVKRNPQFAETVRMIESQIANFPDLPLCPLDYVRQGIEKAGYKCGELSGRKNQLVDLGDGRCLVQKIPKGSRAKAKNGFNNGDIDAILVTRAGNSGISLHASPSFVNTQQRVVIEAEVPEDVVVRVQFFGRFNRKDQMSHPIVETLSSNLPAENRILAIQNNKMRKLSANVTANRDNAAITRDVADILNVVGNEVAFRFLELRPELARKLDISMPDRADVESGVFDLTGDRYVSQLFSRMVMLPVAQQREMIRDITDEFDNTVRDLDARGENPLRAKFFDIHATRTSSEDMELGRVTKVTTPGLVIPTEGRRQSSFDQPVRMTRIEYSETHRPMPKTEVLKMIADGKAHWLAGVNDRYGYDLSLAARNNSDAVSGFLIDAILERRETHMEYLKAQRHETVADALADSDNNAVKSFFWKTEKLVETLDSLAVGSTIRFQHPDSKRVIDGVVTRFELPKEADILAPGRYWISVHAPGHYWSCNFSLATLIHDNEFKILERQASERILDEFENTSVTSFKMSRNVLDGNLFRAAELSISTGIGTQAHFSDQHGQAHRAVVLPMNIAKSAFKELPLRIKDQDLAIQFLETVSEGSLSSSASASKHGGIEIKKGSSELMVSLPGNASKISWLKNNHELMAVTGPFAGSRHTIMASVPFSSAERLVRALYKAGVTLYAHASATVALRDKPVTMSRYARPSEIDKARGMTDARTWFAEQMGIQQDAVAAKIPNVSMDPLAELDQKSGARPKLAA